MVVAVRLSPPLKGKTPQLNMLELVTVANNRYTVSKLRQKAQPPGFCYVCSRIDPSGIFRHPNRHLYQKGFFPACEHFPKPPETTFVQDNHEHGTRCGFGSTPRELGTGGPSVNVTIRQESRSTLLSSHLKRGSSLGSTITKTVSRQTTEKSNLTLRKPTWDSHERLLPPLSRYQSNESDANDFRKPSPGSQIKISKQSMVKINTSRSLSDIPSRTRANRITVIPTALNDSRNTVTDDSRCSKLTTPSKSMADFETNTTHSTGWSQPDIPYARLLRNEQLSEACGTSSYRNSGRSQRVSEEPIPYINPSDGLQDVYSMETLLRDSASLERTRNPPGARPRAAGRRSDRHRRGQYPPSESSVNTDRPESGHLRYHHRSEDDTVPYPGFELPPTPFTGEKTLLELEHGDTVGNDTTRSFRDTHSSKHPGSDVTDDVSLRISLADQTSEHRLHSGRFSFCRCASNVREVTFTSNKCKTCGKYYNGSDANSDVSKSKTAEYTRSLDKNTFYTRQNMLNHDVKRTKTKPGTDEDIMDINSNLRKDDPNKSSWTREENFPGHFDDSSQSWYKTKGDNINPLVDPEIHKLAYLHALRTSQYNSLSREGFVFDESKKLRKPNVFSYYPLLPYTGDNPIAPEYIGLRPDDSSTPKKGKYMKHIFGDVRPDDFYEEIVRDQNTRSEYVNDSPRDKVEPTKIKPTSGSKKDKTGQQVVAGSEKSSISLRMRSMTQF